MDKQLYECDPTKNVECNKRACLYNPNALYKECYLTSKKEFILDENRCPRSK